VLNTSEGLILIDALNNTKEAVDLILGGMRRLGLDPAQIRYVLVTHGHGDHYGGAQMIADRYRARVVASEIDSKMMETGLEFDAKLWDRPAQRDVSVKDGETLTLGDATIRLLIKPGHTRHTAMIWGGTSFNFGRDMLRFDGYIAATERVRELSAEMGVDVLLSNHPGYDGTVAKLKARAAAFRDDRAGFAGSGGAGRLCRGSGPQRERYGERCGGRGAASIPVQRRNR
jgi:metallo-beta-lactamase class B